MSERRRNRLWLALGLFAFICLAYTAGFGVHRLRSEITLARSPDAADMEVFWEAWNQLETHFFGETPSAKTRTYGAIRGSLALLDPHTVFIEPIPRELEQDQLRGQYGGIGVTISRNAQGHVLLNPYPESPAEQAGLAKGDRLLAIDGEPVDESAADDDVKARLRGEIGTTVTLTVERTVDSRFDATIERANIQVPSVTWRMETPKTGYVHLTGFTERTASELETSLAELEQAGAAGVVLDLRGNRGGLLEPAVAVASRFLRAGDVVLRQMGRVDQRVYRAEETGDLTTRLVVLVDADTASAAEIVAGALQDNDRALLVGEQTFGKGSVQEIYDLSDGSSLHVTAAIWLTPDRHRIEKNGLMPDVAITSGGGTEDEPLEKAVGYLESG